MKERTLKTLEYHKIVEQLAGKAISSMGKDIAGSLKPSTDLDEIRLMQQETSEASGFIVRKGSLPLGGITDIRHSLQRVETGGALNIEELLQIGDFCYVCRKVITYSTDNRKTESFPILDSLFDSVSPFGALEKEINRCIINNQELSDDASPKLYEIRRSIKTSNDRIREQLNSIIHSQAYKNMLQDNIITIRSGRYCVPIKLEYRQSFPGMVHDQSSTGATVFMEPMSVVQLNNKIKTLHTDEENEIEKILRELSYLVAEQAHLLAANLDILIKLDFIFAKGELSLEMKASKPNFNRDGYIDIKKGRHPLLDQAKVVPIDIYLGKSFSILLITGPNTGGKTVALKTLGLLALMGQAGLHIPAFDNSDLALYTEIFADIGDEQSIEQSLSTFSAHMSNIVKILEEASLCQGNSLVLLDELGAGTDPTEGAALAMSILQFLYQNKIHTAVTTHYSELKVYALSTEGVENASCEFDVETLRPTYRLLIGVPGKSNAFAISKKLGLPDDIINNAKEFLSHEDQQFEDVITDLEINKKSVEIEKERASRYRQEAAALKTELEKQREKLNKQRDKVLLAAKEEALKITWEAKDEADRILKEMQKQMKEGGSQRELEESRRKVGDMVSKIDEELDGLAKKDRPPKKVPKNLKKGDGVFVHSMHMTGVVSELPDRDGYVTIQAGIMKLKVKLEDLSLNEKEEQIKVNAQNYSARVKSVKSQSITPEVDLRGQMVEEGLEKTDKYLDDAYLAGLKQVTIIHGKGTGALRSAVQNHLKGHPHVKSQRPGSFGEGDLGVTIVELN